MTYSIHSTIRWLIPLLFGSAAAAPAADGQHQPSTFCNPLSLANYPVGRAAF